MVGGRGGGVPLKLGVSSLGDPTKSGISSRKNVPSGVLFPPKTRGDVIPTRGDLRSAGRGGTGLMGAGDEEYSTNCSTSSSIASSSRHRGGEIEGEKSGGSGGAGSSGGGCSSMVGVGESGGEKGETGELGENEGGEGGGSVGGGPGERQGEEGVDEGVSGAGESGGGGGAGSSGGGGLSSAKVTHLGEAVSSLVCGLSSGPNTSSRSGAGEPRYEAGDKTFR